MTMESFLQEDILIDKVYPPKNRVKLFKAKLKEMQVETDECTIMAGDFNTSLQKRTDPADRKISLGYSWTQKHYQL